MRRLMAGIAVVAGVLAASGCGLGSEGSSGEGSGSAAPVALWDPCTAIDDATLTEIGVDPASVRSGVAEVEVEGWKVCAWNNDDYHLNVMSTKYSLTEVRNRAGNKDFADMTVGGRQALRYRTTADRRDEVCDIAFSAEQGAIIVFTKNSVGAENVEPPCVRAEAAAEVLAPVLPK